MNFVQPALRRPFTIVVLVVALALGSIVALLNMPRDIFPTHLKPSHQGAPFNEH
jgi:multidrug efflux pump subunit AcrB